MNTIPTIDQIKTLDGRIFEMLSSEEASVVDFYLARGRMYDVAISIISQVDPDELERASTQAHAQAIIDRANRLVSVTVSPNASGEWDKRAGCGAH